MTELRGPSTDTRSGDAAAPGSGPLAGRTIVVTAERRGEEQAKLFRRRGATVVHAPTMHTVDLTRDADLRRRTTAIIEQPPEWAVATTGFGMRLWFEAADSWGLGDVLVTALRSARIVARGPKAQSVCRQRGLDVTWSAPRESMPEVIAHLRDQPGIGEATVAVQLFDIDDHPTIAELRTFASVVEEVSIYRWRHPLDPGPARALAHDIVAGTPDAVTFTSQPAIRFLVEIAEAEGVRDDMVAAFNRLSVLPVCVGPVCATAGEEAGITTMIWPEPFRLVPMVNLTTERLSTEGRGSS